MSKNCKRPLRPASTLRKTLKPLLPGLVRAERGASGGYRFTGNRRRITLMDIVALFEPDADVAAMLAEADVAAARGGREIAPEFVDLHVAARGLERVWLRWHPAYQAKAGGL